MTFSSIIRKNFIHNIRKFMSVYFVNTLIVVMLFIFGSLMFNSDVLEQAGKTKLYEAITMSLVGIIIFSIVFITYSNISFLKYRGKEFGMYITLGMTTKDLIKLLFVENLGILLLSIGSGLVSGAVFGKLFYLGMNEMLPSNPIDFEFHVNSVLLSVCVFLIIFLCNFLFSVFYIRKSSIVDILRSASKREIGKNSITIGLLAFIIFVMSAALLPKALLNEIYKEQLYMATVFFVLTLICPYVLIGTLIAIYKVVMKRFNKLYNNQLLLLSNLSHRFLAYKNSLYMVSILLTGAIYFVGISYSIYASTEMQNDKLNPYDVMFIENEQVNKVNSAEVEKALQNNGSSITQYDQLEYVDVAEFRELKNDYSFWGDATSIISEANFSKHMKRQYDVKPNEALWVKVYEENREEQHPRTILTVAKEEHLNRVIGQLESSDASKEQQFQDIEQALKGSTFVVFEQKNIGETTKPFVNYQLKVPYSTGDALVVDDSIYETFKNAVGPNKVDTLHLIKGDINEKDFLSLVAMLRDNNGLDDSDWEETISMETGNSIEGYRPIFKDEELALQLESSGIIFFIMIFMGILFTVASGVVLYYKVLTDIEEEKERIISLKRIGITFKELQRMVSKELAVTFFMPTFIGMGLGLYYIYVSFSNDTMKWTMLMKSSLVCIAFLVIQVILYFVCRRKYFSELDK
ncbi:ABC transporter permease [Bacillus sp. JJ722]|uniref:ABC transporter permease n=1 Tax=Bacillus sp. JJ722 TaxID=3122973 RepID=UPI002FFE1621